jgi:hypothetical protein
MKGNASVAGTDLLCIKLSKKFKYIQKLNKKVSTLIAKNLKLLSSNPPEKVSVKRKLDFVLTRLNLEKEKLKIKQEKAELALVKKKCPSYDVLSRFNL